MDNSDLVWDGVDLHLLLADEEISDAQWEKIRKLLKRSQEARSHYFQMINLEVLLRDMAKAECEGIPCVDMNFWQEMLQEEKTAPKINLSKEKPSQELIQKVVYPPREKFKVTKFHKFTLAACAAIVLLFVYLNLAPKKQYAVEVATVVDQINARWVGSKSHFRNGERLWTNQGPVILEKGVVEIQYDEGVDMLVEGPASFTIERSGVYIEYGRLFSRVSKSGLGFVVETPTNRFVDLGTEFGVQADVNGSAELHVIKGKVQLCAGSSANSTSSQIISENEAIRYNANTGNNEAIPVHTKAFVRSIDSTTNIIWRGQKAFDLADIVGGGNGLGTGRIQRSIDPETGNVMAWELPGHNERSGPNQYLLVEDNAFIDGVFVPDGGGGPIQVTSLGNKWKAPDTSNFFKYNIVNSLRIPISLDKYKDYPLGSFPSKEDKILQESFERNTLLRPLGIVAENTSTNLSESSIFLHANLGVTFDLDRIRGQLPNARITSFKCTSGIGEITNESAKLDVYILVDGQQKRYFQNVETGTVLNVDVELDDGDRFLSLVVTEGQGDRHSYDWGLFVNPRLQIE